LRFSDRADNFAPNDSAWFFLTKYSVKVGLTPQWTVGAGAEDTSCGMPHFGPALVEKDAVWAGNALFREAKVTILTCCKCFIVNDLCQNMKNIPKIAKKLVVKPGGFAYCPP
jgi:hypothetical protein